MPRTLALVACCKLKLDKPAPAKDLYISPLFKKIRARVERRADDWAILSAAHGIVLPDTVIEPYDVTLNNMVADERRAWARRVIASLRDIPNIKYVDRIEIYAGVKYREFLEGPMEKFGIKIDVPFRGMGVGDQLGYLTRNPPM